MRSIPFQTYYLASLLVLRCLYIPVVNTQGTDKLGLAPQDRAGCQPNLRSKLVNPAPSVSNNNNGNSNGNSNHLLNTLLSSIDAPLANSTGGVAKLISNPSVITLQTVNQRQVNAAKPKVDTSEGLRQLRQLLVSNNYDAYLVTPIDEHATEYVSDYDRRLRFITGFGGSNGYALILLDRAVMFTDGRYAIQANQELDCNWWLVVGSNPLQDIVDWLQAAGAKGLKIATDARLLSSQNHHFLADHLKQIDCQFSLISQDLVDVVWNSALTTGNPNAPLRSKPSGPLFVHPIQFAGNLSWHDKILRLADKMSLLDGRHYILSALDEIAWLFNLRGSDIPMTPLFKSYVFISRHMSPIEHPKTAGGVVSVEQLIAGSQQKTTHTIAVSLYVDLNKITPQVRSHLRLDDTNQSNTTGINIVVKVKDYDSFFGELRDKLLGAEPIKGRLLLNSKANANIHVLGRSYDDHHVMAESLVMHLKAVKSDLEVQGMRSAHWRDSLAISMLLARLDDDVGRKGLTQKWSEVSAAQELTSYRALLDYNRGESFETISAFGANSAIIHYKPADEQESGPRWIGNQSVYLLDCGGQYLDGTTDITRTTHYGEPSEFQREAYTRVLMGAIDLMSLIVEQPSSSTYRINDLAARRHLLEVGLDYPHGTGHGIGLFSMVHESPWLLEHYMNGPHPSEPSKCETSDIGHPLRLQPNMFTSVEPGYYKENEFGIRLENIVVLQRLSLPRRPNDRQAGGSPVANKQNLLRMEPISLVPFEPKLIKSELLSNRQKTWLNSYNLMVRLRIRQQMNYYLAKMRQQAAIASATTTSSFLYQKAPPLVEANNKTESSLHQLGYYNFLKMDAAKLEELLELTHRWVMSKTELIPLDLPASLQQQQQQQQVTFRSGARRDESASRDPQQITQDGQRLMLAYMSTLPFSDREAGDSILALRARSWTEGAQNESARTGGCVGSECDLWLLGSMSGSGSQLYEKRSTAKRKTNEAQEADSATTALMDLFQLSGQSEGESARSARRMQPEAVLLVGMLGSTMVLQVLLMALLAFLPRRRSGRYSTQQTTRAPNATSGRS